MGQNLSIASGIELTTDIYRVEPLNWQNLLFLDINTKI